MKRLSLLIFLALAVTVGSVYAAWVYTETTDVMDVTEGKSLNLTAATSEGSYGTYTIDVSGLTLSIDPKEGTTHTTALYPEGQIVITFTPSTYAPKEVKDNGVVSTYWFTCVNDKQYESQDVVSVHEEEHDIVWVKQSNGSFTCTIAASEIKDHITLTEFNLDTKGEYDIYDEVLDHVSITIHVSDGQSTTPNP